MNLAVRGIDADIRWNDEGSFHKDPGRWREPGRERRGPTSSGEFVVLAPLVGVAGVERLAHPIQHLVIELQSAQLSGTMVIDVSLLLDLADDRAAAVPASDKTRERKIVLHSPVLFGVTAVKHTLDSLPQFPRDQGLVFTEVRTTIPFELARVVGQARRKGGRNFF